MAFVQSKPVLVRHLQQRQQSCLIRMTSVVPTEPKFAPGVLTLENEGAYAVMAAAKALEHRTGKNVIHLEIGQPGFSTPDPIISAGVSAIHAGHTKYSSPAGIPDLRQAIAEWMHTHRNLSYVSANNVVVGPGAKPGLFFTALALIRGPQDRVLIPDPGFPSYLAMVNVAGGTPVPVPLRSDMRSFDMQAFRAAVDEHTRLVVLNSPGNPTGGVIPREDLEEIANLAKIHDFWVISDEIYSQLVYDDSFVSIAQFPEMERRTIIVDGFSKSFCMTGWRLGWAIMPEELAHRVELLLVHSVGCTATFVQHAGIAALQSTGDGRLDDMRAAFQSRRDLVVSSLNAIPGVSCMLPQGAFYAWADIRKLRRTSKEVATFLLNDGFVATLPGTDFGNNGEGFIRLSYVSNEDVLREGLARMAQSLGRLTD